MAIEIPCPTCGGKGTIPDPKPCGPMGYAGPNGENWPHIPCRTCGGTGWVIQESNLHKKPVKP